MSEEAHILYYISDEAAISGTRPSANKRAFIDAATRRFNNIRLAIDTTIRFDDLESSLFEWIDGLHDKYLSHIKENRTIDEVKNLLDYWRSSVSRIFNDIIEPYAYNHTKSEAYIELMEHIDNHLLDLKTDVEVELETAEKNTRSASEKEVAMESGEQTKKVRPVSHRREKTIEDIITNKERIPEAMAIMHKYFDNDGNKSLAIKVQAAVKAGLLTYKPSYEVLQKSFSITGTKTPYNNQFSLLQESDYKQYIEQFRLP